MNLLFESLNLLQILLQAKKFLSDPFKFERKNLAHKERFCSNSTNSMKDSRHEKPACLFTIKRRLQNKERDAKAKSLNECRGLQNL